MQFETPKDEEERYGSSYVVGECFNRWQHQFHGGIEKYTIFKNVCLNSHAKLVKKAK